MVDIFDRVTRLPEGVAMRLNSAARVLQCHTAQLWDLALAGDLDPAIDFSNRDLRGLSFAGQNLHGFDFSDSLVDEDAFEGADIYETTRLPEGYGLKRLVRDVIPIREFEGVAILCDELWRTKRYTDLVDLTNATVPFAVSSMGSSHAITQQLLEYQENAEKLRDRIFSSRHTSHSEDSIAIKRGELRSMEVLIVGGRQIACEALRTFLEYAAWVTCSTRISTTLAFTLSDAVRSLKTVKSLGLVFFDLNLADEEHHGAKLFEQFQSANHSRVPVVILTRLSVGLESTVETLRRCLSELDAFSVMLKTDTFDTMSASLSRILAGERAIPDRLLDALVRPTHTSRLSERQMAVARAIARGLPNKAIAVELNLSEGNVRQVVSHIYEKLGVHKRGEIAAKIGVFHGIDSAPHSTHFAKK
jgi:DNA-binding NarL/FixJ family response regulator